MIVLLFPGRQMAGQSHPGGDNYCSNRIVEQSGRVEKVWVQGFEFGVWMIGKLKWSFADHRILP